MKRLTIYIVSTKLIKLNICFSVPHRLNASVSLETNSLYHFKHMQVKHVLNIRLCDSTRNIRKSSYISHYIAKRLTKGVIVNK